jgi:hypothetical protein
MPDRETELEMATRHVAEQEGRIKRQLALIARREARGLSTDDTQNFLAEMRKVLAEMTAHVSRLSR